MIKLADEIKFTLAENAVRHGINSEDSDTRKIMENPKNFGIARRNLQELGIEMKKNIPERNPLTERESTHPYTFFSRH